MRTASGGRRRPISTHAPAGGATRHMNQGALPRAISTHAPAGGATHGDAGTGVLLRNFYSRPCGRGDRVPISTLAETLTISTHAPAGGATQARPAPCRACSYFYSRPCGRGDETGAHGQKPGNQFLLTPLREGRPSHGSPKQVLKTFLLTPLREGRRVDPL